MPVFVDPALQMFFSLDFFYNFWRQRHQVNNWFGIWLVFCETIFYVYLCNTATHMICFLCWNIFRNSPFFKPTKKTPKSIHPTCSEFFFLMEPWNKIFGFTLLRSRRIKVFQPSVTPNSWPPPLTDLGTALNQLPISIFVQRWRKGRSRWYAKRTGVY